VVLVLDVEKEPRGASSRRLVRVFHVESNVSLLLFSFGLLLLLLILLFVDVVVVCGCDDVDVEKDNARLLLVVVLRLWRIAIRVVRCWRLLDNNITDFWIVREEQRFDGFEEAADDGHGRGRVRRRLALPNNNVGQGVIVMIVCVA
jgi:hypothetical protein